MNERDLESYLCGHPKQCLGSRYEIIGRQVRVDHGIIDVLALWRSPTNARPSVQVIELKAREIQAKDISQVLRYRLDVYLAMIDYAVNHGPPGLTDLDIDKLFTGTLVTSSACTPVLIGYGGSDNVLAAASSADIGVMRWHHNANGTLTTEHMHVKEQQPLPQYARYSRWMHRIAAACACWCEGQQE